LRLFTKQAPTSIPISTIDILGFQPNLGGSDLGSDGLENALDSLLEMYRSLS
jgi:hypothetical protein